jgi:hypothetical protein
LPGDVGERDLGRSDGITIERVLDLAADLRRGSAVLRCAGGSKEERRRGG